MSAEGSQPRPSPGDVFAATAFEVALTVAAIATGFAVIQILFAVGVLPQASEPHPAALLGGPILMLCAAVTYAASQRRFSAKLRQSLTSHPATLGRTATIVAIACVVLFAGSAALSAVLDALNLPVQEQPLVRAITDGGWRLEADLLTLAFSALVLAPIAEEWLFRHLLFRRVHLAAGPVSAYLASAVLFALSHFNASGLPIYVWQAIVFASAYRLSGRIAAAMLVHFGNNALTLVLLLTGANPD
ncbi:MAG: CPBP family intramembrane metalloprotease [Myxococcales bacterium FL481]|nr:MAG: CPBP family intramembrane metalloprotease [Myxococcales bacterium FL481]